MDSSDIYFLIFNIGFQSYKSIFHTIIDIISCRGRRKASKYQQIYIYIKRDEVENVETESNQEQKQRKT